MFNNTKYPNVDILGPQNAGKTILLIGLTRYLSANKSDLGLQSVTNSEYLDKQISQISDNTIPTAPNEAKGKKGSLEQFKESTTVFFKSNQTLSVASHDGKRFTSLVRDRKSGYQNEYPGRSERIPIFVVNPFLLDQEMALRVLLELTQRFQNREGNRNGFIKSLSIASRTLFLNMRPTDNKSGGNGENPESDGEISVNYDNSWNTLNENLKKAITGIDLEGITITGIKPDDKGEVASLSLSVESVTDKATLTKISEAIIKEIKDFQGHLELSFGKEYDELPSLIERMPHSIVVFSRADIFHYLGNSAEIKKRLNSSINKITPSQIVGFNRFIPTRFIDVKFDENTCRMQSDGLAKDNESCKELWLAILKESKKIKDRADWSKSLGLAGRAALMFSPLFLFFVLLYGLLTYPVSFEPGKDDDTTKKLNVEIKYPLPMSEVLKERISEYKMAMINYRLIDSEFKKSPLIDETIGNEEKEKLFTIIETMSAETTTSTDTTTQTASVRKIDVTKLTELVKSKTLIDVTYTPASSAATEATVVIDSIPVSYYVLNNGKWEMQDKMKGDLINGMIGGDNVSNNNRLKAFADAVNSLAKSSENRFDSEFKQVIAQAKIIRDALLENRKNKVDIAKSNALAEKFSEMDFNKSDFLSGITTTENLSVEIPSSPKLVFPDVSKSDAVWRITVFMVGVLFLSFIQILLLIKVGPKLYSELAIRFLSARKSDHIMLSKG